MTDSATVAPGPHGLGAYTGQHPRGRQRPTDSATAHAIQDSARDRRTPIYPRRAATRPPSSSPRKERRTGYPALRVEIGCGGRRLGVAPYLVGTPRDGFDLHAIQDAQYGTHARSRGSRCSLLSRERLKRTGPVLTRPSHICISTAVSDRIVYMDVIETAHKPQETRERDLKESLRLVEQKLRILEEDPGAGPEKIRRLQSRRNHLRARIEGTLNG